MDASLEDYLARIPRSGVERDARREDPEEPLPSFRSQIHTLGLGARALTLIGVYAAEMAFVIAAWSCVGAGALNDQVDPSWLFAAGVCLVSLLPLRTLGHWLEALISIGLGGILRERLLAGILRTDPDGIRRSGVGALFGRVLEVEQIEQLGIAGGFAVLLAVVQLAAAGVVLTWGAEPGIELALLFLSSVVAALLLITNARKRTAWTQLRLALTARLVENLCAHRTRVVQQPLSRRHDQDDADHGAYAQASDGLDRSAAAIEGLLAQGYLIVALGMLIPVFLAGREPRAAIALASTLGGILLAAAAFRKLTASYADAAAAVIAWRSIQPLMGGAEDRRPSLGDTVLPESGKLIAKDIVFRHERRMETVLAQCSLTIEPGDFLMLEGASGSGKSTLAAVLAGLRQPHSGLLLASGLDPLTLGAQWCRHVTLAPQYHQNHIFSAPLSFNLLLGRAWPHTEADLADARVLVEELGLAPLVERMPSGLEQWVGETGWQLSQGERSRVFLARALLQRGKVIVLDESLAALDPMNLARCAECILRNAPSALVIAHP